MYENNMENIFIYCLVIAIVFTILKFIELRVNNDNEDKPLKLLVKDGIIVFLCSAAGLFLSEQILLMMKNTSLLESTPDVFTGEPGF